jgi:hypothetical protein
MLSFARCVVEQAIGETIDRSPGDRTAEERRIDKGAYSESTPRKASMKISKVFPDFKKITTQCEHASRSGSHLLGY